MKIEIETMEIKFGSSMSVNQANKIIDSVLRFCSIGYVESLYRTLKEYIEGEMSDLPEILQIRGG